jgi:excisionase family DNA binding protein
VIMDDVRPEVKTKMHVIDEIKRSATLTVDEAHQEIGTDKISRASLYNAINRNELPHIRLGRRILIPRNALAVFLACTVEGKRA